MSWDIYTADGRLIERGSDTTLTVTTYSQSGAILSTRPYSPDEDAQAEQQIIDAARLDDLAARIVALEEWRASLDAANPNTPNTPTWEQLQPPSWWLPGGLLTDADGTVYRNTSGTVLTTPPSRFPGGGAAWIGQFFEVVAGTVPDPEPETHPQWSADATYKVGDLATRGGIIYRCRLAHGPEYQGTWGPPQASVWTPTP